MSEQEPVSCNCGINPWHDCDESKGCRILQKVKNAAPVRTKDLTDDEIDVLWDSCGDLTLKYKFARAVIAADREKNK